MVEGWLPGILHIICCPLGNGLLAHMPRPALPPQATWRSGDGYPWTEREKRKIYGWRHTPAAYNAWQKHLSDAPGNRRRGNGPAGQPSGTGILTAMGRSVSPSSVRECWPSKNDIVPRQP